MSAPKELRFEDRVLLGCGRFELVQRRAGAKAAKGDGHSIQVLPLSSRATRNIVSCSYYAMERPSGEITGGLFNTVDRIV